MSLRTHLPAKIRRRVSDRLQRASVMTLLIPPAAQVFAVYALELLCRA